MDKLNEQSYYKVCYKGNSERLETARFRIYFDKSYQGSKYNENIFELKKDQSIQLLLASHFKT